MQLVHKCIIFQETDVNRICSPDCNLLNGKRTVIEAQLLESVDQSLDNILFSILCIIGLFNGVIFSEWVVELGFISFMVVDVL